MSPLDAVDSTAGSSEHTAATALAAAPIDAARRRATSHGRKITA